MRSVLGQVQERVPVRPMPDTAMSNIPVATLKEIPYDYVARFTLAGQRANRVQDVINISTDGAFVTAAIGYSFIPARLPNPTVVLPSIEIDGAQTIKVNDIEVEPGNLSLDVLLAVINGIPAPPAPPSPSPSPSDQLVKSLTECLLVRLCGIDFKYSIIDSGTGRELQNQPIHNIAGLGKSDGDRPFRPLAKPMLFMPRSTIRIEVEEVSEGPIYGFTDNGRRIGAELFIVFHGYKILGYGTGQP
jgi:hypothetical protein